MKALNYGFDVITARIFSGHLMMEIQEKASQALKKAISQDSEVLNFAYCNGVGVKGKFVTQEIGTLLGRDFQLSMEKRKKRKHVFQFSPLGLQQRTFYKIISRKVSS